MIDCIFILNGTGEVIIEKHWRGNAKREDSLTFWSALLSALRVPADVPAFIPTAKGSVLIHLHRSGIFFVASAHPTTLPLSVSEFLSTLADTLLDYFGELNEHAIKDNFISVYELLDEMLDYGFPLTLEPNILKQLIPPPTMMTKVIGSVTGDTTSGSAKLPFPTTSPRYPWRREGIRYTQNEVFVDVCESIDAIFSASSSHQPGVRNVKHSLVRGALRVNSRLSGVPDISMSLRSVAPIDDTALHRCVRQKVFQETGQLSFIPPDGVFTLMEYVVRKRDAFSLPVDIQPLIKYEHASQSGSVAISVQPRFTLPPSPYAAASRGTGPGSNPQSMSSTLSTSQFSAISGSMIAQVIGSSGSLKLPVGGGSDVSGRGTAKSENVMTDVEVKIPFGQSVSAVSLSPNIGTVEFDSVMGTCRWIIGALPRGLVASLTGSVTLASQTGCPIPPPVLAKFNIQGLALSGMYVDKLELDPSEPYKYYKGLRCITSAGRYEVRQAVL